MFSRLTCGQNNEAGGLGWFAGLPIPAISVLVFDSSCPISFYLCSPQYFSLPIIKINFYKMNEGNKILNSFWSNFIESPWKLGLLLIFIWGIPRFILVLNANVSGSYQLVSLVFVSMWISPWIFLSKFGRRKMGLKMPSNFIWLIGVFVS